MPRYEFTTDDELTRRQKDELAWAITDVHVVSRTTGAGHADVGGHERAGTYRQGSVRAGRDADTGSPLLV